MPREPPSYNVRNPQIGLIIVATIVELFVSIYVHVFVKGLFASSRCRVHPVEMRCPRFEPSVVAAKIRAAIPMRRICTRTCAAHRSDAAAYVFVINMRFGFRLVAWLRLVFGDVFVRRPACVNTTYVRRSTCILRVFVLAAARELRGMRALPLCLWCAMSFAARQAI